MKISEAIAKLQTIQDKHGDVEVMFNDPESSQGPYGATGLSYEVAEFDQYPEEYDMPEGFKFVEFTAW